MLDSFNKLFYLSASSKDAELLAHDEYGVYIRLLEHMWKCGGKLPHDDTKIALYLRITAKKWQNYKKILQNFFIFSDRSFTHLELKQEYHKVILKSQQNALNSAKRWGIKSKKVEIEKVINKQDISDANGYAMALRSHIQRQCLARASKGIKDKDKRLDDRLGQHKTVDNSASIEELQAKLIALFIRRNVQLPEDGGYLHNWLESGISSKAIYQKIEQIMQRISQKGLEHPKSFAYFAKEIESGV